jgi:hypothetical protein
MIKALLHKNTKTFDFAMLGSPFRSNSLAVVKEWDAIYDDMWSHLSESSPNLIMIREIRPVQGWSGDFTRSELHQSDFNPLSCKFSKLLSLDTNCHIKSGILFVTLFQNVNLILSL